MTLRKRILLALRGVSLACGPSLGVLLFRALSRTLRMNVKGLEYYRLDLAIPEPTLFAFWHDQLLLVLPFSTRRPRRYAALISRHPDGDPIAKIVTKLGLDVVRGSSSRGGLKAVGDLAGYLRDGGSIIFTPDGPKGPRHRAGEGAIILAQRAQVRIVPVGAAVRPRLRAGSWDRLQVPVPFARVSVVEGEAIRVSRSAGSEQREHLRSELERGLKEATACAESMVGRESES